MVLFQFRHDLPTAASETRNGIRRTVRRSPSNLRYGHVDHDRGRDGGPIGIVQRWRRVLGQGGMTTGPCFAQAAIAMLRGAGARRFRTGRGNNPVSSVVKHLVDWRRRRLIVVVRSI